MNRKTIFLLMLLAPLFGRTQQNYWQQEVNYQIAVTLNDREHTLDGNVNIEYINHSPDTLFFLWFHLWPNAYKTDQTAFSEQLLINRRTDFYFSKDKQRGYINRLNFKVNGITANLEDHPNYIDVAKLVLPAPLLPGKKITIATPFHEKLPDNFSRGGHTGESYQISQWYPKPAVYDATGWHPMPYLDQGEFYSEFGSFEVKITVPQNYAVAATGELQEESEKQWLQQRREVAPYKPVAEKKSQPPPGKKPVMFFPTSAATTKTLTYKQDRVHDFAWFADKRYRVLGDTLQLPSGRIIQCYAYYLPEQHDLWKNSIAYMKRAILFRSTHIGEYPYNTVTVVQARMGFPGGMEYPTITAISGRYDAKGLDLVIEHELGHNWFYGILASNEHEYPWMDEGMNSYYDNRYEAIYYPKPPRKKKGLGIAFDDTQVRQLFYGARKDQPINTPSYRFTEDNYTSIAYGKTAQWMELMEKAIGRSAFDSLMQQYYRDWQFKHPQPENAEALFAGKLGSNNPLTAAHRKKGLLPGEKSQLRTISFMPILGYNHYDGFMAGGVVHNYSNPAFPLRILAMPLYGFQSQQLNGIGRLALNLYPATRFSRIDIGVSAARFSKDDFKDEHSDVKLSFLKIVPFARFNLKENSPLSSRSRYAQFKYYSIREDFLDFVHVETPTDTFDRAQAKTVNRSVSQLQLGIQNIRALYPYRAVAQVEMMDDIYRATLTAEEFFNYNDKDGGLDVRLFAGKIFYKGSRTSSKIFANDRYAFNMTGPKGEDDYTFSDYFLGRNEFEKFPSQQIMVRDGAFKFRTDLLFDKPGRTDNWMAALNLVSDIPDRVNPLSILPVKLPLKLFADIGTNAEAWEKNSGKTRFLFDAGIQLSLLKGTLNVYLPLVYSPEFSSYSLQMFGKKRSFKNLSFSINLNNFGLRRMIPQFSF